MEFVTPSVYMLASTSVDNLGMEAFLDEVANDPNWTTDAKDAEELIEVAGRTCYRSFSPGLNPNVTRVREGNAEYLKNILRSQHGSVLEHASVTFGFANVSRVFTHEIVRHRLCAFSQESLRYVRLTDLRGYFPQALEAGGPDVKEMFEGCFQDLEDLQKILAREFDLDNPDAKFGDKKRITSAMRRLAPIGLATTIIVTTNHRNWRHLISLRTSSAAEEEIRLVMDLVAQKLKISFPNIYQDMGRTSNGSWEFDYGRV